MSQERLPVRKIREALRLHHEAGLSNRAIARVCRVSNSTVGEYLARAEKAGIGWPLPDEIVCSRPGCVSNLGGLFRMPETWMRAKHPCKTPSAPWLALQISMIQNLYGGILP